MSGTNESLFERVGQAFVATAATAGPWDSRALSGGSVAALLGHVLDERPERDFELRRLTIDFVRPAPIGRPLGVHVDILDRNGTAETLDLTMDVEGEVVTRARARRHLTSVSAATHAEQGSGSWAPPDRLLDVGERPEAPPFLKWGAELRLSTEPVGDLHEVWCRFRIPVVAGEPIGPSARAVLPFDLVNKIGAPLERDRATTINPDVSGHLVRLPVGEWVRLTGNSYYDHGVAHGISMATLSDEIGPFGMTSTSQLVEPIDV